MLRAPLCLTLALFGFSFVSLHAVESTEDLPPVPFIIGGDEVVAPAKAEGPAALPLTMAEEPEKPTPAPVKEADKTLAKEEVKPVKEAAAPADTFVVRQSVPETMHNDLALPLPLLPKDMPVLPQASATTPVPMKLAAGDLDAPLPLVLPTEEAPAAKTPAPAVAPVAAAPVAEPVNVAPTAPKTTEEKPQMTLAPVALTQSKDALPGYMLEQPKVQTKISTPDGSIQIKEIANTVGKQNNLLPEVTVRPAVAMLGREFPELHVDQIPLDDLLGFLKDFTPKTLRYELPNPVYVTVDLKAKSVEEVMAYLASRYPLEITTDAGAIYIRPAIAKVVPPAPMPAMAGPAPVRAMAPVMPVMVPAVPAAVAAAPVVSTPAVEETPVSVPEAVMNSWQQVQVKARLYELNERREELLKQRENIRARSRLYNLRRATD